MLVSSVTLCTTAAAVHCGIRQSHDPPRAQLHRLTSFRDGACVPARPDPLAKPLALPARTRHEPGELGEPEEDGETGEPVSLRKHPRTTPALPTQRRTLPRRPACSAS